MKKLDVKTGTKLFPDVLCNTGALERHIEITRLVQGLGHATFILKHQEFANLLVLRSKTTQKISQSEKIIT